jgi:hypothetical protein
MGLRDFIESLRSNRIPQDQIRDTVNGLGSNPTARMNQVDVARGANIGPTDKSLQGLNPEELAQMDRYAWGQQGGLGGLPLAAGYEGVKALQQSGFGSGLLGALGSAGEAIGIPKAKEFLTADSTTSPASLDNVWQFYKGATDPEDLGSLLKRKQ